MDRRAWLATLATLGVGTPLFQRALAAQATKAGPISAEMIAQAEWIAGITLADEHRQQLALTLTRYQFSYQTVRKIALPNAVPSALTFTPAPLAPPAPRGTVTLAPQAVRKPATEAGLAFLPVTAQAELLRTRQITSLQLTQLYLRRLKQYDPTLFCVVTLTEELALRQAKHADEEIAAGRYRGPLHGIPWGAKDIIAYPGYPTTWGALPYKEQVLDTMATVARKLDDAGAVLVAKLSVGALAMNDRWFGGLTRNPWHPQQGSSGSSAGSASAVVAGLVSFALGSETLGSIVSPCARCGATGLRPTFGRISRAGCMALAWSMDKIGPIARSVADCALVLGVLHGSDPLDLAAVERPFTWPTPRKLADLRVGYVRDELRPADERTLRELGVQLVPITMPERIPASALVTILFAEAATAFDDLTRRGIPDGLNSWPETFRAGQFIPAVEYLRANRVRSLLMHDMAKLMDTVDLYIGGNDVFITNLTGHPTVVLPNGFRKSGAAEVPTALTFTGRLFGEAELLAVAEAFQQATGHHRKRPQLI
jgi:Asp-tRNA(Asn)/Glu-tRNA(Gln) amidotransferase A subunit family amidase